MSDNEFSFFESTNSGSITGHTAQGGGWENIIIDFAICHTSRGDVSPSWIYTALTRTKNKTYFVNYPAYE